MASTEGDSDSKNGDSTLSSLDNPLPDGADQIQPGDGKSSGGGVKPTSSSSLVKATLPLNSEITTINLWLVLPGVSQPLEVVVSKGHDPVI